jgi:hypothetical protein
MRCRTGQDFTPEMTESKRHESVKPYGQGGAELFFPFSRGFPSHFRSSFYQVCLDALNTLFSENRVRKWPALDAEAISISLKSTPRPC